MASTTMTYTILTGAKSQEGSIKYFAQHGTVPAGQILDEAQAYIYERLRAREMTATVAISASAAADTISLPTGFLDPIKLQLDGYPDPLEYLHETLLDKFRDEDGDLYEGWPFEYAIWDEKIQFKWALDAALAGDFVYYKIPDALAASTNETNWLTDRFPTLLRRTCLMFSYEHRHRNAQFSTEAILVESAIEKANVAADMARRGQIMSP